LASYKEDRLIRRSSDLSGGYKKGEKPTAEEVSNSAEKNRLDSAEKGNNNASGAEVAKFSKKPPPNRKDCVLRRKNANKTGLECPQGDIEG